MHEPIPAQVHMLIGILQTGQVPAELSAKLGDYPHMFETLLDGHGLQFRSWLVEHMTFPPSVHAADGWLITGSRHGVYEDHPFIAPLEAFIRNAIGAGVPVAGICFGHQIMATALGGTVEKFGGGWAVGPQDYQLDGETLSLNAWHQDQVTALPPGAEVFASSDFCRYAGLAYGTLGWSIQPHPEFDDAFVRGLMATRARGVVPQARLAAAEARLGEPIDSARIADRIARFFMAAHARQTA